MIFLYLCFFISGLAGLIYEVVWARYLGLYIGSTGLANIVVLATFMGGLALGNYIFGKQSDRSNNTLKLYILLETAIGICALLFEPVFLVSRDIFFSFVQPSHLNTGGLVAAKTAAAVLCIFLPSCLMGGTMPPLARHIIRKTGDIGPGISMLYFINSLGAATGCLLAGFLLIPLLGLNASMVCGAVLNFAAAAICFAIMKRAQPVVVEPAGEDAPEDIPRRRFILIMICACISGAVSMMYEVSWIRLLTLVVGGSTYSFPLMLATFILGLSIGGLILSFHRKTTGYNTILGLSEAGVGLAILGTLPLYMMLPYFFNNLASHFPRDTAAFGYYLLCKFSICAGVMLIPTVLLGITLPAATRIVSGRISNLGGSLGIVFAINTLGAIAGVLFAAFIGLPRLGIKGTIEIAVALNCIMGMAILLSGTRARRTLYISAAAGLCIAVSWAWYAAHMKDWDKDFIASGLYRNRQQETNARLMAKAKQRKCVFYRDGMDTTISVKESREQSTDRILLINGKTDASSRSDLITQKMLAHISLLCREKTGNVLIIGLGSGATVGAALTHDVKNVDVVEISPDIIDAAPLFQSINNRFWEDPRVSIYCEDARTFLQATRKKYNIIISQPSNPWVAGIASLFSREYFEECREHLAEGGSFVNWVQTYEFSDEAYYMILETFSSVFPRHTLWNLQTQDTVLMGAVDGYGPNFNLMRKRLQSPAVQADMNPLGVNSLLTLLSMQMQNCTSSDMNIAWFGRQHSDFFPKLDFIAPRTFFTGVNANGASWLDDRNRSPANSRLWALDYLNNSEISSDELRDCYLYAEKQNSLYRKNAFTWAWEWYRRFPGNQQAKEALVLCSRKMQVSPPTPPGSPEDNESVRKEMTVEDLKDTCLLGFDDHMLTRTYLSLPHAKSLLANLDKLAALMKNKDADVSFWRGMLLFDLGQYKEAIPELRSCVEEFRKRPKRNEDLVDAGNALCRSLLALDKPEEAAEAYSRSFPPEAQGKTGIILLKSLIHARKK